MWTFTITRNNISDMLDKVRAVFEDIDIPIFLVHNFCLRKTLTGIRVVPIFGYRIRHVACLFLLRFGVDFARPWPG